MCILGANDAPQVSEALLLLLSFLPLLFCSSPILKLADSFFCCSNLPVRPPVNFLFQLLYFSTPEILSGSLQVSLLIVLIWWPVVLILLVPRPPGVYLFIWLHQVPVDAHGIFSLHCSRWGLQLWQVGSSAVACGIFSCVGSSVVACGIQFPDQGLNPVPLALGAQSLSRWITREVPLLVFLLGFLQFFEYI